MVSVIPHSAFSRHGNEPVALVGLAVSKGFHAVGILVDSRSCIHWMQCLLTMRHLAALTLFAVASAAQEIDEGEPNNTLLEAQTISSGVQVVGRVNSAIDRDFYRLQLANPCDLRLWTGPRAGVQVRDTRIQLLDGSGTLLLDVDDGARDTHGFYTMLTAPGLTAGTYHVVVEGAALAQIGGGYRLDVVAATPGTFAPAGPLRTIFETPGQNDPRLGGVATPSLVGSANHGGIETGGGGTSWVSAPNEDYDVFWFRLNSAAVVTFSTRPGTSPSIQDPVLHLCDANLQRIAFDDDSGPDRHARLTSLLSPGIYHVAVNGFSGSDVGGYAVDIAAGLLSQHQAEVVVHPGGCGGSAGTPHLAPLANEFGFLGWIEQPILGSTFCLDLVNLPPSAPLVTVIDNQSIGPYSIGSTNPNCIAEIGGLTVFVGMKVAEANGTHQWEIRMPFLPALVGLPLHGQAAVIDPGQNGIGLTVSNRVSLRCGLNH